MQGFKGQGIACNEGQGVYERIEQVSKRRDEKGQQQNEAGQLWFVIDVCNKFLCCRMGARKWRS